jgi:hypothetical protein
MRLIYAVWPQVCQGDGIRKIAFEKGIGFKNDTPDEKILNERMRRG